MCTCAMWFLRRPKQSSAESVLFFYVVSMDLTDQQVCEAHSFCTLTHRAGPVCIFLVPVFCINISMEGREETVCRMESEAGSISSVVLGTHLSTLL